MVDSVRRLISSAPRRSVCAAAHPRTLRAKQQLASRHAGCLAGQPLDSLARSSVRAWKRERASWTRQSLEEAAGQWTLRCCCATGSCYGLKDRRDALDLWKGDRYSLRALALHLLIPAERWTSESSDEYAPR
jgi:hypothetical protein